MYLIYVFCTLAKGGGGLLFYWSLQHNNLNIQSPIFSDLVDTQSQHWRRKSSSMNATRSTWRRPWSAATSTSRSWSPGWGNPRADARRRRTCTGPALQAQQATQVRTLSRSSRESTWWWGVWATAREAPSVAIQSPSTRLCRGTPLLRARRPLMTKSFRGVTAWATVTRTSKVRRRYSRPPRRPLPSVPWLSGALASEKRKSRSKQPLI